MAKYQVAGKTFLITGGASGLGAYYAEEFLKNGAKAVAIADIAEETGVAFAEKLNQKYPGKVTFVKCDAGDEGSISATFDQVVANFGQLDVMFNNAGIMNDSPRVWWKMCEVNVQGLIAFSMKAIKHMRKDEGGAGGAIINVASVAAITKTDLLPIYWATKAAVLHYTQCVSANKFYDQTGIRVMAICPGATDTALLHKLDERGCDKKAGEKLQDVLQGDGPESYKQRPESAAAVVLKMYEEGANGSIWLTAYDKPGKDITSVMDSALKSFLQAIRE